MTGLLKHHLPICYHAEFGCYRSNCVRRDESRIVRDRFANALLNCNRNFWDEMKKLHRDNSKSNSSAVVDGCSDDKSISVLFDTRNLYTSVPYDRAEINNISDEVNNSIGRLIHKIDKNDFTISADDVREAVGKLKPGKNDGMNILSSDYFLNANRDLYVHLAYLFTAMVVCGIIPREFVLSSIVPIPKN